MMINYQAPYRGKYKISCPFGKKGNWAAGWHIGNDLVGLESKDIYAIGEGRVTSINAHGKAYGNHLTVLHPDGKESLYAHLSVIKVKKGQGVTQDTILGIEGATGNVNGRHLHIEVHEGGWRYPPKNSTPQDCKWLLDIRKLLLEGENMDKKEIPQWQKEACKMVCETKSFTNTDDWLKKVENAEIPTWGEIFGVLAKCL